MGYSVNITASSLPFCLVSILIQWSLYSEDIDALLLSQGGHSKKFKIAESLSFNQTSSPSSPNNSTNRFSSSFNKNNSFFFFQESGSK